MKITNRLSDLEKNKAIKILLSYLVKDKIYSRKQESLKDKHCDLFYRLTDKIDDMYITKNNSGELADKRKRIKGQYIFVDKIQSDTFMNPEFIARLENKSEYEALYIQKYKITQYISNLDKYHQAILFSEIYKGISLKAFKLGKYQNQIKALTYDTKRNHLIKAIDVLYDLIVLKESES